MEKKIPSTIFDTNFFDEKDRLEIYRESIGAFFETDQFTKEGTASKPFQATISSYLIGEIMLIDTKTTGHLFTRSSSKVAFDNIDHFVIQAFISGDTLNKDLKEVAHCDTSKLIVIDGSKPWRGFNSDFQNISLVIPRRLLAPKLISENDQHGKVLDPVLNPFADIFKRHILSLHASAPLMSAEYAQGLVQATVDIAAAALNSTSSGHTDETENSIYQATRLGIKQFLETNINNPNLSLETVQHHFNLKRSTLYRMFPDLEGGIMKYVKTRRLQLAYRQLAGGAPNQTVSQVAFAFGFESVSAFTRAFKAFFNELPSDVLKHRQPPSFSHDSPARLWESWFKIL